MACILLGLDIGTSVTKAALFDRAGAEIATASVKTSLLPAPSGWSELDPDRTCQATADVCREVLEKAGVEGADVAAVAPTGAMVGAWTVDAAGAAIRPRSYGTTHGRRISSTGCCSPCRAASG